MELDENTVVKIFMMPQQSPCGPGSTCCGPVGQTDEEITKLKESIERGLSCTVEILNVSSGKDMKENRIMLKTVHSFGVRALPFIVIDDDVVCFGQTEPDEAIRAIRKKFKVRS